MSNEPIPFTRTEDGYELQDKLMPLGKRNYGVIAAGFVNVEGGHKLVVRVVPGYDRSAVQRIINEHGHGRLIEVIESSDGYGKRH